MATTDVVMYDEEFNQIKTIMKKKTPVLLIDKPNL